jgi:hypothetical protein
MMKKAITVVILLPFFKIATAQNSIGNSIIFDCEGNVARPIVIYKDGQYLEPPFDPDREGEEWSGGINEYNKARLAFNNFKREASRYKAHYLLNNGVKYKTINILRLTEYAANFYSCVALEIESVPEHNLLSNNPKIGTNTLIILDKNDRPVIKNKKMIKREVTIAGKEPDGTDATTIRLKSIVDIDGDGTTEFIYQIEEYEYIYIQIYSKKYGKWKMVYEGMADGS